MFLKDQFLYASMQIVFLSEVFQHSTAIYYKANIIPSSKKSDDRLQKSWDATLTFFDKLRKMREGFLTGAHAQFYPSKIQREHNWLG